MASWEKELFYFLSGQTTFLKRNIYNFFIKIFFLDTNYVVGNEPFEDAFLNPLSQKLSAPPKFGN